MIDSLDKTCLTCGIQLRGRRDKKFCSDQCRSTHYNRVSLGSSHFVRQVNTVLRKNWRILHELQAENTHVVSEDLLRLRGFDFNFCTSIHKTHEGNYCYYCYDLGYFRTARNQLFIVDQKIPNHLTTSCLTVTASH